MTAIKTTLTPCQKPGFRAFALGSTLLISLLATQSQADDLVWDPADDGTGAGSTGGTSNTWDTSETNWYNETTPTAGVAFSNGDSVFFRAPPGEPVDLGAVVISAGDITFETNGYVISGGPPVSYPLAVTGEIIVSNAGDSAEIATGLALNATVSGAGNLTLSGAVNGTVNNTGTGTITVLSVIDAINNDSGTTVVDTGGLTNNGVNNNSVDGGEVHMTGGTFQGATTVAGTGVLDIDDGDVEEVDNTSATSTVEISGGTVAGLTNTDGTATMDGGTLGGLVVNGGDVTTTAGDITFNVNVTGGTLSLGNAVAGDATVSGTGAMTLTTGADVAGTVTNSASLTFNDGTVASLTNTGGTAGMAGGSITGDLDVSGGAVTTTGGSIGGDVDVTGGTLALGNAVSGDAAVSGTGVMTLNTGGSIAGTLTNDATFTFAGGALGDVDNTGTFILSGDQTVGGTFNNSGLLDATEAGAQTLTTTGTFTTSGDITTDGSNTLTITSPLIDVLAGANFNSVAELDGTVILDGAVTSAADLEVTGPYTLRGSFDNAGVLTVSDTLDTDGFALTNTSAGQLIATGDIVGAVTNAGDFDVTGGTVGDIDNLASGDTTITGATSMTGDVTNAGTFALDDGTVASLTNTGGTAGMAGGSITGDLDVSGGAVTTTGGSIGGDVDVTGGTLALGNAVSGDAAVSGTGVMTLNTGGSIAGTLTNDATFTFAGGALGDVDNTGTFILSGDQTVGGTFNNSGLLDATEAGAQTLTTTGTFTTSGDITTDGSNTLTITSPLIDVLAGANFNSVAELDGTVILDGAVTSAADLEVTGPYTLRGSFDNAGVLTVSDTLDTDGFALTNTSAGQLIATGDIVGAVTNAGDFDVTGGTVGDIDNLASGDTTITGATSMTGDVTNAGTFALDDGTVASLTNTGGTAGMAGGSITGDLDVSGGAVTTTGGSIGGDVDVTGGTLALGNAVSGDAAVSGTGVMTLNTGGSIAGTLTNDATFTFAGGALGDVDNTGTFILSGDQTVGGTFNNSGLLDATEAGAQTLTTTGTFTTSGDITTDGSNTLTITSPLIDVLAGANFNSVAELDGTVILDGAVTSAADLEVTGPYTLRGSFDNAGVLTVSDTLDTDGFALTNTSAGQLIATGDIVGAVTNAGDFDVTGGTVGDIDNLASGDTTITGATSMTGDVTNAGTFALDDGTVASLTNTGGTAGMAGGSITGDLDVSGGAVTTTGGSIGGDVDVTGGTLALGNAVSGDAAVSGTGVMTLNTGGSIAGTLTNDATFTFAGGALGDVDNTGTFILSGDQTVGGTFNNSGLLDATEAGAQTLTTTGTFTTSGDITTDGSNTLTITSPLIDVLAGANFNSVAELDGTVILDGAVTSAADLEVTGPYTLRGSFDNAGVLTVSDTLDTDGFALTNTSAGQLIATGDIVGAVTNAGDFDVTGGTVGDIDNLASGDTTITGATSMTGDVTNAGTFALDDGTVASLTNTGGTAGMAGGSITGDLDVSGGAVTTTGGSIGGDVDVTGGTLALGNAVSGDAAVSGTGVMTLNTGGSIAGTLTNDATFTFAGGALGDVDNLTAGDITVTGTGAVTGTLDSIGTIDIDSGAALSVAGLTSINDGSLNVDGTFLGDLTVGSAGALTANSGSVLGSGTQTFINNGSSSFDLFGTVDGDLVANSGISRIGGTVTRSLTANSGAIVNVLDGATVGTYTQNSGTVSLVDANPTTDLNISGDAVFNGTIALDVDLSDDSTAGDTINVGGNVSGSAVLSFSAVGESDIDDIALITYGGSNTLTFSSLEGLPRFGEFEYFLSDTGTGVLSLRSRVNSGIASLASSIGVTQTIVGSVINRPTSPYVADLATDPGDLPCGAGAWARPTYGQADASGTFKDINSGTTGETPIDLIYRGIQIGGDFACFDDRYGGFDMAFGVIGGYNDGDTTTLSPTLNVSTGVADGPVGSVTTTDFNQTFGGIYMTASRDRFFADLQMRYEVTNFTSSNKEIIPGAGFDLNKSKYDTKGGTVSGAVGYAMPVESVEGLNVVGSMGFSYSDFNTDSIDLGGDGTVKLEDSKIKLGFLSGTVARTKLQPDEISLINYFGTATVYNDFADDPVAKYIDSTDTANPIQLSKLGTYGEISAGVNYVRLLSAGGDGKPRQLNVAGRFDYRKGDNLESWGITAQIRYQF